MPCELCRAYLHDYFQQPVDKEHPLVNLIHPKKLKEQIPQLVNIVLRCMDRTTSPFHLYTAKSNMTNYFTFIARAPTNPYEVAEIFFEFLKQNKQFAADIDAVETQILELDFLKIKKTDPNAKVIKQWLAFLIASLFEDMYSLHDDHSKRHPLYHYDLSKGLPGQPKPIKKKENTKSIQTAPDEEDLYF